MPGGPEVVDDIARATLDIVELQRKYEDALAERRRQRDEAIRSAIGDGWDKRGLSEAATARYAELGGDPSVRGLGIGYHNIRRVSER
jgi:hypothetical protein